MYLSYELPAVCSETSNRYDLRLSRNSINYIVNIVDRYVCLCVSVSFVVEEMFVCRRNRIDMFNKRVWSRWHSFIPCELVEW